ncbi:phosphonate dehydrogenase [Pseudorhodoplanes sp.]|uniref:phosphonate dehydrogenase n=1 Tax=Pseudorhodoplanes sp. TaxID=1934341 RepID=UPI003918B2BB
MKTQPRILVTNWVHQATLQQLALLGDVDANETRMPWPREEVMRRAEKADAILAFMPDSIDARLLARCKRLRVVACALKGYDNFDLDACTQAGVFVTIVPDLLTEPTAELAVGLAIGLGRNIREGDALVRSGRFDGWRPVLYGTGLDGSVVAIVGMGHVGRAVAQRLAGFGCRMLGVDPSAETPPGMIRVTLHRALEMSDVVIVCAPLTPASRHLIGNDALARMKHGALLINVGRGSVVDESAVLAALETGKLGGYAADVFEMEDRALSDRPEAIDERLRTHPRTLFTPHLGSAVTRVRQAIELRAVDNIADVLEGRRPRDAINEPTQPLAKAG